MTPLSRSRLPWQTVLAATVLAALAAIAVIVVLGGGDDSEVAGTDATAAPLELTPVDEATGDIEPLDATVTRPDGTEVVLGDEIEGLTVINFFASWCPPCIAEMPDFETVSQELDGQVAFLGLAVQDRTDAATEIVEETGVTYPWARDAKGDVAAAAGVTQMPATMFVDADGEVVSVHSGALDADELRELIADELGVTAS